MENKIFSEMRIWKLIWFFLVMKSTSYASYVLQSHAKSRKIIFLLDKISASEGRPALAGALISLESGVWTHPSRRLGRPGPEWVSAGLSADKTSLGDTSDSCPPAPLWRGLSTFLPVLTRQKLLEIGDAGRGFKLWRWHQRRPLKVWEGYREKY